MAEKLRKGCVTTIYYAKFFIARACVYAGSGVLLFISRFLTLAHLCEASHKWLCGSRISTGMAMELKEAQKLGIPVREISAEQIQGGFAMEKKYGVWAIRSAGSVCGAAQSWCKHGGKPIEFDTMEQAESYAKQLNESCYSPNVHYAAKEIEPELKQSPDFSMRM
jgi:hypothetical protein